MLMNELIFDVVTRDALLIHEGQIHPLEGPFQSKAEAQEAADLVAARLEDDAADSHFAFGSTSKRTADSGEGAGSV
jgi:hypothetical protein